jgi:predicted MFS family arabinose efflux permease
MEIMPQRKVGLFNVLIGLGGACGSFTGSFLADKFGFVYALLTSSITFLLAYVAFKRFT